VGFTIMSASLSTGVVAFPQGLSERGRTAGVGEFVTPAFNAADFAAPGATWTVQVGDLLSFNYALIGKLMVITYSMFTTTIAGTPGLLTIKIPGGYLAAALSNGINIYSDGGAINYEVGFSQVAAGANLVQLFRPGLASFTNGVDNQILRGYVLFSIT